MIIELITVAALEINPDYDKNVAKARYMQDLVSQAIDDENYLMACEAQRLITHYMTLAGRPITKSMIQESRELEQQLCTISQDRNL